MTERWTEGWAQFSEDRQHRYWLGRRWSAAPLMVLCGLNPSSADDKTDDQTIKKECGFAKLYGFGGILKVNLATRIATHVKDLRTVDLVDGTGWWLLKEMMRTVTEPGVHVLAWGAMPLWLERRLAPRMREVLGARSDYHCFGKTQTGAPRHTSRIPYDTPLVHYVTGEPYPRPTTKESS